MPSFSDRDENDLAHEFLKTMSKRNHRSQGSIYIKMRLSWLRQIVTNAKQTNKQSGIMPHKPKSKLKPSKMEMSYLLLV